MTTRLDRARHMAHGAEATELEARASMADGNRRLRATERSITTVLERSSRLGQEQMSPAMRGLLAETGARKLSALTDEQAVRRREVDHRQAAWDAARTRARALRKLVERIEAEQHGVRQRADRAAWQDLVAATATRRSAVRA
ncbi:MAG: hypothetical protein ACFCVK_03285 [Acidimicrobiales bacterium]